MSRWVGWCNESRGARTTKVPHCPKTWRKAKADNPATWADRAQAEAAAKRFVNGEGGGVGIVLGELDGGLSLGGIDLDTCRDEAGGIATWAAEVVDLFASYAEVSPSGTGAKVFFAYTTADLPVLREAMGTDYGRSWKHGSGEHPPAIELYLGNRYFAVTDQKLEQSPAEIRTIPSALILQLIRWIGPAFAKGTQASAAPVPQTGSGSDGSRSATAFRKGAALRREGKTFDEMVEALLSDPETHDWAEAKGRANKGREFRRIWEKVGPDHPNWTATLQMDAHHEPHGSISNAMIALENDPALAELVAFDEMQRTIMLMSQVPYGDIPASGNEFPPRPLNDTDVTAVTVWMQRNGLVKMRLDVCQAALALRAQHRAYHPVRDYLNGLTWDRKPRIGIWLSYYLGAEHCEYVSAIGRMFLISMVARIMQPGCKADYMIILESDQGDGKSKIPRILGGQWFSDGMPSLGQADPVRLSMHLRGKWLIEVAELEAISKAEAGALKHFLTIQDERYTPKFGRNEVVEPRQVVFLGTTNKSAYLRDETGARRFWPVKTGALDLESLEEDRDQLFAEAVASYRESADWWPDRAFESQYIKPEQDNRYEADVWEELIREYLFKLDRATVLQVAREALSLETPKIGTADQRRVSAAMERSGWQRAARGPNGERLWQRRPEPAEEPA